jgi:hypothetical protein
MEKHMRRRKKLILILTLLLSAGGAVCVIGKGCGCASKPDGWRAQAPPMPPADLMAGAWEGTWASDSKPIKGDLSANIEKLSKGVYHASFTSQTNFGLTDESVCVFHVTPKNGLWEFEGSEDLGFFKGGTYTYKGTVNGEDFVCTYDSTFDKGVFRMRRAQPTAASTSPTTTQAAKP